MKVKVKSHQVLSELNNSNGKTYRSQWAFIEAEGVDKPFKIGLGKDQSPYAPGEYEISARSYVIDQYDRLSLLYPDLVAVAQAAKKAA